DLDRLRGQSRLRELGAASGQRPHRPGDHMTTTNESQLRELPADALTHEIIGAAIEVHRHLGSGLLEALYERAMCIELEHRKIAFRSQAPILTRYRGDPIGDYYADLIVADSVIVELKCVTAFNNAHVAQLLSYLESAQLRLGLLINFAAPVLWKGVRRVVR
ncbi:MAG TPA: GxxExxY protein, partial [Kofleriaceae bacterium]|nr:GxxExxY protein [Kofleriaceae bacterium]